MLPNITIVGNTTGPAELSFTQNGKARATLTVVSNKSKKTDTGWENVGRSPFIRVTLWEDAAEALAEALGNTESARVIVSGQLMAREWEGKDGGKRESMELENATVGLVPSSRTAGRSSAAPRRQAPSAQYDPWATPGNSNDEPPF